MNASLLMGSFHSHSRPRATLTRGISIAISCLVSIALLAATQVAVAKGKPGGSGGSKPATSQILPVSLGAPAECANTNGFRINNGDTSGLYVVGQGMGCENPGRVGAVHWAEGLGMQYLGLLPGSTGSSAEGLSEDGTIVGWTNGNIGQAFVLEPGAVALQRLLPLDGMVHATAENISKNGRYIVGTSSTDSEPHAVVWEKKAGSWEVRDLGSFAGSPAVADDGSVLLNTAIRSGNPVSTVYSAWFVEANGNRTGLPGFDVVARDITAGGNMIVGYRREACPDPCGKYPVPVYWTLRANGTWNGPVDLPAIDGVDSEALAVAVRKGQRLIVGHGFTKKDGIMRAVAWIEDSQGKFSLQRLAAIDGRGKAEAQANDVNDRGQVTGTSLATGLSIYAVMWQLP